MFTTCRTRAPISALLMVLLIAGCRGRPLASEVDWRQSLQDVAERYRPNGERPPLPALESSAGLREYLLFAMLNNPSLEAAYFDWAQSIERITTARSLPDPRLTFESDMADTVMTLMPGLMMDFPGPGKLRAAGEMATAESTGAYYMFEQQVLRVAYDVKTAYHRLGFLQQRLDIQRQTLDLLNDLEELARQQNAAGRVTLQDVLRAQIERDQLTTEIENLEDSRAVLVAQFKAALGSSPGEADPPLPSVFELSEDLGDESEVWARAVERNPALRRMEADVRQGQAAIELAGKSRVPDFSLGLEADLKAAPVMFRPSAGLTLPIWRDKIAAEIAAAQAQKKAAEARLSNEQIALATELAAMLFMHRESLRNIELLDRRLLPKARQSFQAARAGYVTGRAGFLDLIDAERDQLDFELALVEARTQRELALSALSFLIAAAPPQGAPILSRNSQTSSTAERATAAAADQRIQP